MIQLIRPNRRQESEDACQFLTKRSPQSSAKIPLNNDDYFITGIMITNTFKHINLKLFFKFAIQFRYPSSSEISAKFVKLKRLNGGSVAQPMHELLFKNPQQSKILSEQ